MTPHPLPISILTFNILAPCYKRLHDPYGLERPDREGAHPKLWTPRLDAILDFLLSLDPAPDVIALQEVWFHPPFLARLTKVLSPYFHIFLAQRPLGKMDGLAILVRRLSPFIHPSHPPFHLASFPLAVSDRVGLAVSDRVGLAVSDRVGLAVVLTLPSSLSILIVNAHLTFPHNGALCCVRTDQSEAIIQFVSKQPYTHAILVGDLNGDHHSPPFRNLVNAGFANCFTALHGTTIYPITHLNHRQQNVFVDHIFLRISEDDPVKRCRRVYDPDPPANCDASTPRRLRSVLEPQPPRSESPSPVGIRDMATTRSAAPRAKRVNSAVGTQERCELWPVSAVVYPERLGTEQWPVGFDISDHRPVFVQLRLDANLV